VDFTSTGVTEVEQALERLTPGRWRRLSGENLRAGERVHATAGWRIGVPASSMRVAEVDHLLLFTDGAFPYGDIRIAVPGMRGIAWPHVEEDELLCLPGTSARSSVAARVERALEDVHELLNWDDDQCRAEFGREIQSYWLRKAGSIPLYSLADPGRTTRVAYYCDYRGGFLVVDDQEAARQWLRNAPYGGEHVRFRQTLVVRLPGPLLPSEYPADGAALIRLAGEKIIEPFLNLNRQLPILLAFEAGSGKGFVGLIIESPKRGAQINGFRPGKEPRGRQIRFESMPTQLCHVQRVDRAWAFGRDHGQEVAALRDRRVAVIGCGALGGAMGLCLAQAGVGHLAFVDGDVVAAHNPARHILGPRYLGSPKALAMAAEIKQHVPTITEVRGFPVRFESLTRDQRLELEKFDLVVCAGIDRRGEVYVDRWREGLAKPPNLLCTFSEEFALVGHAIAIVGHDHLSARYERDGNFNFLATEWPAGTTLIREAGCGNDFQPFGAVDLMPTVQMASQLALDLVLGRISSSKRRTWFGERQRVLNLGGTPLAAFTGDLTIHEYPWAK
jgi:ThiF family